MRNVLRIGCGVRSAAVRVLQRRRRLWRFLNLTQRTYFYHGALPCHWFTQNTRRKPCTSFVGFKNWVTSVVLPLCLEPKNNTNDSSPSPCALAAGKATQPAGSSQGNVPKITRNEATHGATDTSGFSPHLRTHRVLLALVATRIRYPRLCFENCPNISPGTLFTWPTRSQTARRSHFFLQSAV
jgi:hypothetical protein